MICFTRPCNVKNSLLGGGVTEDGDLGQVGSKWTHLESLWEGELTGCHKGGCQGKNQGWHSGVGQSAWVESGVTSQDGHDWGRSGFGGMGALFGPWGVRVLVGKGSGSLEDTSVVFKCIL